jgi:hypothetical protein
MIPPELQAALQGGGGAPAGPAPGGLPPELMAALGGGGAPPPPAEAAPPEGALHGGNVAPGDPEEHYRSALDALEMGMKADNDEARIATMMKCATSIQGELANSQKGMDGMAAGKMDAGTMRRSQAPEQAY